MKKKSTCQPVRGSLGEGGSAPAHHSLGEGGFLNLRVLFGLCVMLAGVFLALVSFGPATTGFAQGTTREEMTLTLAQALNISQPPACVPGQEMFNDVPASNPFCPFIEELARRGITGGCGGGNFCPGDPVTRQQMAVFLVKTLDVAKNRFAVVNSNGTLARGRGVVSTARLTTGFYQVIFDTNITGCAYIGTVVLPGLVNVGGFLTTKAGTTNTVLVNTFSEAGGVDDRSFQVEVVCP
jgi:S-layer homology domain